MKRPYIVNFVAINSNDSSNTISIRMSMSMKKIKTDKRSLSVSDFIPSYPLQSLRLLIGHQFQIKMNAYNEKNEIELSKEYDSDRFGRFDIKIPSHINGKLITQLEIYDALFPSHELLGKFSPRQIKLPKKIVISDFDKTLVDTTYSTPRQIYNSLRNPISKFPTVLPGFKIFQDHIENGFQPFIVSASPHFYIDAIRDWLHQNEIFNVDIFLKDYRRIFSFSERGFSRKDLTIHGFYKLNQLVNILLMTGIPEKLTLIGDSFESDINIYLTLAEILKRKGGTHSAWNKIKNEKEFRLNPIQTSRFLEKFYRLEKKLLEQPIPEIEIWIRRGKKSLKKPWESQINTINYF